jgi:hypothetical protein
VSAKPGLGAIAGGPLGIRLNLLRAVLTGGGRFLLLVGFTTFPGEIFWAPRGWVEKAYPSLIYLGEAGRGGRFAAWEEPELFATEIRAAFKPLR